MVRAGVVRNYAQRPSFEVQTIKMKNLFEEMDMCVRIEGGCFSFIRLVRIGCDLCHGRECEERQSRLGIELILSPSRI